eukprot:7457054-Heterocapsa_arctica.AAC.1
MATEGDHRVSKKAVGWVRSGEEGEWQPPPTPPHQQIRETEVLGTAPRELLHRPRCQAQGP